MFSKCNIRTIQLKDGQTFSGCVSDFEEQEDHTIVYHSGFFTKEYIHIGCIASDHIEFSFSKLFDNLVVWGLSLIVLIAILAIIMGNMIDSSGEDTPPGEKQVKHSCQLFSNKSAEELPLLSTKHPSAHSAEVKQIQKWLHLAETGQFSGETERIVRQFQKDSRLKVDGKVGEKTWKMLQQRFCSQDKA
ncbi:peptidoglycan-binding domain-containing protein [Thioflexithrix psekupsensis]|uniref:Peptidoglycan binding-like domain-containing protein n=1 Tax=Thioflexithrix psekupsensis TaxID=1570016 RepID=A0A251X6G2_9GAMM|nr:peptidoglycan-binding domain-containing protein [Thioflexithrix psekupsensis]OUD13051.1 hypothetical protein TPSD3_10385 [Thioflexithrix psekupsensis]